MQSIRGRILLSTSAMILAGGNENSVATYVDNDLGNVAYAVQSAIQAPTGDLEAVGEGRTFGVTLGTKI
jgi:hypothetical protein